MASVLPIFQKTIVKFTKIWAEQYLRALRERHYPVAGPQDVPVRRGDVVLVETTGNQTVLDPVLPGSLGEATIAPISTDKATAREQVFR